MKALLPLLLLVAASPPGEQPRRYLVSIVDIPLKPGESVVRFSIETWGVQFDAVCKIPSGWRIRAGSSATPDGVLEGNGSLGATWLSQSSPPELNGLVLVTLSGAIQHKDRGAVPATFKGSATISAETGEPQVALTARNIRLVPARDCPKR